MPTRARGTWRCRNEHAGSRPSREIGERRLPLRAKDPACQRTRAAVRPCRRATAPYLATLRVGQSSWISPSRCTPARLRIQPGGSSIILRSKSAVAIAVGSTRKEFARTRRGRGRSPTAFTCCRICAIASSGLYVRIISYRRLHECFGVVIRIAGPAHAHFDCQTNREDLLELLLGHGEVFMRRSEHWNLGSRL